MAARNGRFRHKVLAALVGVLTWACLGAREAAAAPGADRVRPLEARARALVAAAIAASPTVASLVEGLGTSDVVVFVEVTLDVRFAGNLRFLSCGGGARFLLIRVFAALSPEDQVAALGHELQHACEVGEAPGVRDERGLGELMARIGRATGRRTFETDAAVRVGRQVRGEVARR